MAFPMKTKLPLALFLSLAAALSASAPRAAAATNVVFFMADDLGWNDVGYHGSEIRTPNIDRYYAFPVCSPTRAALFLR